MTLLGDDTNCKVISMIAHWFSTQTIFLQVLILSKLNGTRQGGVLSPYLFSRYNRYLIGPVNGASVGCAVDGQFIHVLAYADDVVVLIAPSILAWFTKVTCSSSAACLCSIDSYCDTSKMACMMFPSIGLDRASTRDFSVIYCWTFKPAIR